MILFRGHLECPYRESYGLGWQGVLSRLPQSFHPWVCISRAPYPEQLEASTQFEVASNVPRVPTVLAISILWPTEYKQILNFYFALSTHLGFNVKIIQSVENTCVLVLTCVVS